MKDTDFINFLQWALPKLHMQYKGFRKVRKQVKKRVRIRINELSLSGIQAYQDYLENDKDEWNVLDECCRITISRFYRDKYLFNDLYKNILPELIIKAISTNEKKIRIWSAGCASGEEAYTNIILWEEHIRAVYPDYSLEIIATDINGHMLERAKEAVYPGASLKQLPDYLEKKSFDYTGQGCRLKDEYRNYVTFIKQDIREDFPEGPFHIIFCRNLVFTYFDNKLQLEILIKINNILSSGGLLILGVHEDLPVNTCFSRLDTNRMIFKKNRVY